eukprot:TRINITY_DN2137_c0_g1_i1.p1 TRINITY_DN2137_c0_g1~~TRINITY_DN2137_c0_g1_i1.p1  ORF type:complete len:256 (-),score=44.17 TRINITY_DN2137_c0_g1_i1:83-799(-)
MATLSRGGSYAPLATTSDDNVLDGDKLKKEIRRVEREIDASMNVLTSLSDRLQRSSDDQVEHDTVLEVKACASQLEVLITELEHLNTSLSQAPSTSLTVVQHHRDRMQDYTADFRKTKALVFANLERAQLFSGTSSRDKGSDVNINMESLMREHQSINSSHSAADDLIRQAQETNERLNDQRRTIRNTTGKVGSLGSQFGDIDALMGRISRLKNRNNLILGSFIAVCICFLLWWALSS